MNNNVTQEDAAASHLASQPKEEEENDCISRLRESRIPYFKEEKDTLGQLDQIRYNPQKESISRILKYAEQALEDKVEEHP